MDRVAEAFIKYPREHFLPDDIKGESDWDSPLPIGYGQTNSQPSTVMTMLEWLDVQPGQKALDIGSGSGWTTALLAYLAGDKGKVVATERIPELVKFGKDNCAILGIKNVEFFQAGKDFGREKNGPYERILVSASAGEVPKTLLKQLAKGGVMVIPVKNSIWIIKKDSSGKITTTEHPGFVFVPLLTE
jgi:protein-L-isoaspartate(D-aspartate) O-methyltransferase